MILNNDSKLILKTPKVYFEGDFDMPTMQITCYSMFHQTILFEEFIDLKTAKEITKVLQENNISDIAYDSQDFITVANENFSIDTIVETLYTFQVEEIEIIINKIIHYDLTLIRVSFLIPEQYNLFFSQKEIKLLEKFLNKSISYLENEKFVFVPNWESDFFPVKNQSDNQVQYLNVKVDNYVFEIDEPNIVINLSDLPINSNIFNIWFFSVKEIEDLANFLELGSNYVKQEKYGYLAGFSTKSNDIVFDWLRISTVKNHVVLSFKKDFVEPSSQYLSLYFTLHTISILEESIKNALMYRKENSPVISKENNLQWLEMGSINLSTHAKL